MLTEQEIQEQRRLNELEHFPELEDKNLIFLESNIGDCSLALDDLFKAIKTHLPKIFNDEDLLKAMTRRLDACLDLDLIPVRYGTFDFIGGVAIMAAEGEPNEQDLRKVELICSSFQNDGHYPDEIYLKAP